MTGEPDELWVDEQAGPVVRPFAVARGRTRQRGAALDLIAVVVTAEVPMPDPRTLGTEDERILELCIRPRAVADLAADLALPVGVVRVLLSDLLDRGLVNVRRPGRCPGPGPPTRVFSRK
ncbi:DUF742 domain-containing protein [Actinomadura madurae]|uniref:DUF742 domain-containing protein n=1 Tax=Actinomadura madurae TaxID=1993 RepID=UPI0020D26082|nr:DUF742 domain-containing protein [Actinomadura madurae]MCQ0009737.1 DUF742 domain-containing protein [Actinomadura madurae]